MFETLALAFDSKDLFVDVDLRLDIVVASEEDVALDVYTQVGDFLRKGLEGSQEETPEKEAVSEI